MFKATFTAIALSLIAMPALADASSEAFIAETGNELASGELNAAEFRETLDVRRIAGFTLGKFARRVEAGDRKRFIGALEGFLIETFEDQSSRFEGAEIQVIGSKDRSDRDSIVRTRVEPDNSEALDINWRVMKADGEWRIVDVQVQGLWLAIEQRAQITALLSKPRTDINDVIDSLQS